MLPNGALDTACGVTPGSLIARSGPMSAAAQPALSGFDEISPCLHRVLVARRSATTNLSLAEEKDHA
jgi:hypothetical protein